MPNLAPETLATSVVEALERTIRSNAELLRLLDPLRFAQVVASLQSSPTPGAQTVDPAAWEDLDRWLETLREQDRRSTE